MVAKGAMKVKTAKRSRGPVVREKVYLTYPTELIKEPVIYDLGRRFSLRTNIRGANVSDTIGLVALEIDGNSEEIDRAIAWLREIGVTVEPIEKNVIE
jgi:L-aspartate semialdehyde sulfurtransferase ferredoxin